MPSWSDLRKPDALPDAQPDEYGLLCVQALDTPAGRALMKFLHHNYIDKCPAGNPDPTLLLSLHAKRQLIRELEDQTARGLASLAREKTAPNDPHSSTRVRRRAAPS